MSRGWVIYNSQGVPLVTSKAHNHTAADGSGPLTDDEHDGFSEYDEISAPSAPAANKGRLYPKDDAGVTRPYFQDSDGLESELAGYTLIDSVTLTGTAQTLVNFTSIPAKFRNLRLVFQGQPHVNTDTLRYIRVRFNADTGNNYDHQESRDGAETQALTTNGMAVGIINGALLGFPTYGVIEIPNYLGTTFYKQLRSDGGFMAAGSIVRWESTGQWRNAAAINQIDIYSENVNSQFIAGSVAYLYGY